MDARSKTECDLDELGEDHEFQRRFWKTERVAWFFYALLIAAALTGLTGGGGPLAHAKVETPFGSVEYPRVSRWQAADDLTVRLRGSAADITLGAQFVEAFAIESIAPEPESSAATSEGVRYTFATDGGGEVVFHLRARKPALFPDASVRVANAEVQVRPLILP